MAHDLDAKYLNTKYLDTEPLSLWRIVRWAEAMRWLKMQILS
jgi:hypothetical protein